MPAVTACAVGGPGDRGTETPYAGLTQSGMRHRTMRYGYRWEVGRRFNVGGEGSRQGGFSGLPALDGLGGDPGLDRLGAAATHSVQVRGGVTF